MKPTIPNRNQDERHNPQPGKKKRMDVFSAALLSFTGSRHVMKLAEKDS
jgi:hypothetical protein